MTQLSHEDELEGANPKPAEVNPGKVLPQVKPVLPGLRRRDSPIAKLGG
jgi:hypothetical protein